MDACDSSTVAEASAIHAVGMVQSGGGRGLSYFTSYFSSSMFGLLWGGRDLDQHGGLPRCTVLRYDVPFYGFCVAGDRQWVRAVLVKSVADLGVGGYLGLTGQIQRSTARRGSSLVVAICRGWRLR